MLISSGCFADYRVETRIFDKATPPFGNLRSERNRERLLDAWLQSDYFQRSGLEPKKFRKEVMADCRNAGEFMRIAMEGIARNQGVERWAEKTPANLLYIPQIKKTIPDALIVHIIRDGRDVAASMSRMRWGDTFSWDRRHRLMVCGLYWQWLVRKGRKYGRQFDSDYLEVHYEDLVRQPKNTLASLGKFIHCDLNYDYILQNAIGVVGRPNTSFKDEVRKGSFSPIGRRRNFTELEGRRIEGALGATLRELGYEANASYRPDFTSWRLRLFYSVYREAKVRLRQSALGEFFISTDILRRGALTHLDSRWEKLAEAPVEARPGSKSSSVARG